MIQPIHKSIHKERILLSILCLALLLNCSQVSAAPGNFSYCAMSNTSEGVKFSWNASANASGYRVYRKTGSGSYQLICVLGKNYTSAVSIIDTSVKHGKIYTYRITAYDNTGTKSISQTIAALEQPPVPTVKYKSGTLTVKWAAISKVTGYQIQYSASKNFTSKKTVTVKGKTSDNTKIKGLALDTCYVRIRYYRTVSGKTYYSAWSTKTVAKAG